MKQIEDAQEKDGEDIRALLRLEGLEGGQPA
jgi:hypothetical protein